MAEIHGGAVSLLIHAVLAAGVAASVATDLRHRKIIDRVTIPCMAAGLLLNILLAGWIGAASSLAGMVAAVGMALAMALIAGNDLGGGDVKLLVAIGALRGFPFVLWAAAFAALSGPFLCLVPLARSGQLGYTLRNFGHNCVARFICGVPVDIAAGSRAGRQPFSVAIAAGVILASVYLARR